MANHNPIPPSPETPRLSLVVTEESPEYDAAPKHEAGFAIMPARVLAIKDGYVRGVYSELAKYANAEGICWPSVKTLCDGIGWSRKIVERSLAVLEQAEIIVKERRFAQGMNRSKQRDGYAIVRRKDMRAALELVDVAIGLTKYAGIGDERAAAVVVAARLREVLGDE